MKFFVTVLDGQGAQVALIPPAEYVLAVSLQALQTLLASRPEALQNCKGLCSERRRGIISGATAPHGWCD